MPTRSPTAPTSERQKRQHATAHWRPSLLGRLAAQLADQQQLWGCDAVYVALAQERDAVLITLDGQQQERVPPGVLARTPAEELARVHR